MLLCEIQNNCMEKKYNLLMDYQKSLLNKIMNNYKDEDKCKQKSLNQIIDYTSSSLYLNDLDNNTGNYPLFGSDGFVKNIDFYPFISPEKYPSI